MSVYTRLLHQQSTGGAFSFCSCPHPESASVESILPGSVGPALSAQLLAQRWRAGCSGTPRRNPNMFLQKSKRTPKGQLLNTNHHWADKIDQWVEVLAAKPGSVSLIPRSQAAVVAARWDSKGQTPASASVSFLSLPPERRTALLRGWSWAKDQVTYAP